MRVSPLLLLLALIAGWAQATPRSLPVLSVESEARAAAGDGEGGLSAVERFEVLQGPSPRSAFRRGEALRALGRGDEARAAFQEVGALAREVPGYQRREATGWALRAWWARLFG